MTGDLSGLLAHLGAGTLVGFIALPVLARLATLRFVHDPASGHRALLWALTLAAALMLMPWLRSFLLPHAVAGAAPPLRALPPLIHATGHAAASASALGFQVLWVLGAAWALATALAAALACISVVQLAFVVRRARPAPAAVVDSVASCRSRGAERIRRVLVTDEASVPFVAIPWAPVLVLPIAFAETFDRQGLELIIEHEAAHLDRGDLWTSAVARLLCIFFPLHPVAARIAGDLTFAREAAVDALVSPRDPHRYATLLLDVAAHARFDQLPRRVSMDDTALARRIAMLTDVSRRRPISIAPLTIAAAVLAAVAMAVPMPIRASESATFITKLTHRDRPLVAVISGPESYYDACDAKSAGDGCSGVGFTDGNCRTNADNGRLFCVPPPPSGAKGAAGSEARRGDDRRQVVLHEWPLESGYEACRERSDGEGCSTPKLSDSVCLRNLENNRLVCAPREPLAESLIYYFWPHGKESL